MPPRRISPVRTDVVLRVDGEDVPARRGEPIAVALAASGRLVLGRSVKYHRPRGAVCYAGRCDGCLMRVGGAPSRMTCREPAEEGTEVETQNVLGLVHEAGADVDLLAAADWFFPEGMNHHEMFTWSKAANRAMQTVARRIAGVGKLPDAPRAPSAPLDRSHDVLVVGGGPTGLAAAARCAAEGLDVLLVDEDPSLGGHLAWAPASLAVDVDDRDGFGPNEGRRAPRDVVATLIEEAKRARVAMLSGHAAVAVYDAGPAGIVALVDSPDALVRVRARRVILAQGRHEGASALEGNDLPGVIGSEAASRLLAYGVLPGDRVLLAGPTSHDDPRSAAVAALHRALVDAGAAVIGPLDPSSLVRARGRKSVSSCDVRSGGAGSDTKRVKCDAIVIAPETSAVYELAEQAGAEVVWRGGSFEVVASAADGATRVAWARVIGRGAGVASIADGIAQATAAACAIASELRTSAHASPSSEAAARSERTGG